MHPKRSGPRWWTIAHRLTALSFASLLLLGSYDWFPWFKGNTSGTAILGFIPFTDPLAAIEVALASRALPQTMLIGALILLGIALLLGPIFCGWLCPLGLLLDLNNSVRVRLRRLFGLKRPHVAMRPPSDTTRLVILAAVLGFALVGRLPLFQILSPINIVGRALIVGFDLALVGLGLILVVEFFLPRLWCRTLCPLGALYSLVGRISFLRIRVNADQVGKMRCQACTVNCPVGIKVMQDHTLAGHLSIDDPACTRCGTCLDVCPGGTLRFGFKDGPPPTGDGATPCGDVSQCANATDQCATGASASSE